MSTNGAIYEIQDCSSRLEQLPFSTGMEKDYAKSVHDLRAVSGMTYENGFRIQSCQSGGLLSWLDFRGIDASCVHVSCQGKIVCNSMGFTAPKIIGKAQHSK